MVRKFISSLFATLFIFPTFSFALDCNIPNNIKEKFICQDDVLRKMNLRTETLFKEKSNLDEQSRQLVNDFKIFFNYKIYGCEDKECLNIAYKNAIDWLEKGRMKEVSETLLEEKSKCPIKNISPDCEIYVYSAYKGDKELNDIFLTDKTKTFLSEVKVDRENKCVVLFLSAHNPVIWDIYKTPKTDLRAVVVGGYYPQMIRGIDKNVETINNPEKGCINQYYDEKKILEVVKSLNIASNKISILKTPIIGQNHEKKAYQHNPNIYDGNYIKTDKLRLGKVPQNPNIYDGNNIKTELPSGEEGLKQLIQNGKIRKATKHDIEQIKKMGNEPLGEDLFVTEPNVFLFINSYIALESFEKIPDGLTLINLFIPQDLSPAPKTSHPYCRLYRIKANTRDVKNW